MTRRLICVECGHSAERDARGWEAHLVDADHPDNAKEVVVFCPRCAVREFGDRCQRHPDPPRR